ncbi:MAG: hypothetical protein IT378_03985 [Sandaracinaceae bacterium]|nr:hypothetical protein [Sandaracinaceae bacterium]
MIGEWLRAFLLTQVIEMGVYVHATPSSRRLRERVAIAFAASAMTHPIVWFVIPPLLTSRHVGMDWWEMVACAELFAWLAEALWLWAMGARYAIGWALIANGASFLSGLFLYMRGGW